MRRTTAALAAGLLLVAQLASLAHLAAVPHARCAEHDELVELDGAVGPVAAREVSAGSSLAAAAPSSTVHGHEHCLFGPQQRARALGEGCFATSIAPANSGPPAAASDSGHTAPQVALLLLAPKSSPPA